MKAVDDHSHVEQLEQLALQIRRDVAAETIEVMAPIIRKALSKEIMLHAESGYNASWVQGMTAAAKLVAGDTRFYDRHGRPKPPPKGGPDRFLYYKRHKHIFRVLIVHPKHRDSPEWLVTRGSTGEALFPTREEAFDWVDQQLSKE